VAVRLDLTADKAATLLPDSCTLTPRPALAVVAVHHLSPVAIGAVFTSGGIGSFAGAWFGARFTARFGYGRVLLVTLALGNGAPLGVLLANRTGSEPVGAAIGGVIAAQTDPFTAMVTGAIGVSVSTLWVALSAVPALRSIHDAARS
jgi:MFS family permease